MRRNRFCPPLLKILIDEQRSQNLQVMWSVDGQGPNKNFFHNRFSNIIPPPTSFALKVLGKAFDKTIDRLPGSSQDCLEGKNNLPLHEQASVTQCCSVLTRTPTTWIKCRAVLFVVDSQAHSTAGKQLYAGK
ncbi:hypothetical protein BV898_19265 [Hypsibius exemplaris]|uniref:Uncharacterized protein n=1 Tax=Hypsibius exemplaris TaxID=2072580 RepID=A0A9X6RNX5_HYPEX|nr:hypothetical protein BV898_19265 [Hypsibius exemplaris]